MISSHSPSVYAVCSECQAKKELVLMQRSIYRVWLKRESELRDNRSHAPVEVGNKCLDLSRVYIAAKIMRG